MTVLVTTCQLLNQLPPETCACSQFQKWGNRVTEGLSTLAKVTELGSVRAPSLARGHMVAHICSAYLSPLLNEGGDLIFRHVFTYFPA